MTDNQAAEMRKLELATVSGFVGAKLAIAELEGATTYGSAPEAFAAIHKRLNELIKDAIAKAKSSDVGDRTEQSKTETVA